MTWRSHSLIFYLDALDFYMIFLDFEFEKNNFNLKQIKHKTNNSMIIGVPKEIKNNENRVAITPAGVAELKKHGHTIYVQSEAGTGSGFSDEEYIEAGASILPTIEATYEKPLPAPASL